jgi:hypothetical protein
MTVPHQSGQSGNCDRAYAWRPGIEDVGQQQEFDGEADSRIEDRAGGSGAECSGNS